MNCKRMPARSQPFKSTFHTRRNAVHLTQAASYSAARANERPDGSHLNETNDSHNVAVVPSLALELCHSSERLAQRAQVHPERPRESIVKPCTHRRRFKLGFKHSA